METIWSKFTTPTHGSCNVYYLTEPHDTMTSLAFAHLHHFWQKPAIVSICCTPDENQLLASFQVDIIVCGPASFCKLTGTYIIDLYQYIANVGEKPCIFVCTVEPMTPIKWADEPNGSWAVPAHSFDCCTA